MACSHATSCPLFPLLNESLDGWRRCYCDSADGWRDCARYQQSVRGQYVPLSLLPNGRDARHLQGAGTGRGAHGPVGGATNLADLLFEQAPVPEAPVPEQRRPEPVQAAPRPAATRPRWWIRLMEWMRTPA